MTDEISKVAKQLANSLSRADWEKAGELSMQLVPLTESATAPVEVDVRMRLMKTVAGNVVKDGVGACDALYSLATEHGADPQRAAGFAHHVNGALALLEDDVAKACELTATLARQLAEAKAEIERLNGVVECKTIDANERGNALTASAETKRDLKAQLAEATRRLGEVEADARRWRTLMACDELRSGNGTLLFKRQAGHETYVRAVDRKQSA